MPHDVFISYASKDKQIADMVCAFLEAAKTRCCIAPRDLLPGADYPTALIQAIRQASVIVLVYSQHSDQSEHVRNEVATAISEGVIIIPLRVQDFQISDAMRYFLCRKHWLDALTPPLEDHLQRLTVTVALILRRLADGHPPLAGAPAATPTAVAFASDPTRSLVDGRPRIPLRLPRRLIEIAELKPSQLLQPFNRLLDLVGRAVELQKLERFRDAQKLFSWQVVIGEGGVGKTRLALEFAEASTRRGWHSGFVDASSLHRFVNHPHFDEWFPLRDTFVVIDYAASKLQDLKKLFERCAAVGLSHGNQEAGLELPAIRILLIERHAASDRGWLADLLSVGEKDLRQYLQSAFQGMTELFPPKDTSKNEFETTEQILRQTIAAWAKTSGRTPIPLPRFGTAEWSRIQRNTSNRPLYLQMAAIHACDKGDASQLPAWGRSDLLIAAVEREREYIRIQCEPPAGRTGLRDVMEITTAVLCLTGLCIIQDRRWRTLLREEIDLSDYPGLQPGEVEERRKVIFDLRSSDPDGSESTPIAPDILAEAFTAIVLRQDRKPPKERLLRAAELSGTVTWAKLLRLVQDLQGFETFGDVSQWLDTLIAHRPFDELLAVVRLIPEQTVSLRAFATALCRRVLDLWNSQQSTLPERAWVLIQLGMHLDQTHRQQASEEGLLKTQEAVAICEGLANGNEDEIMRLLARGYHYLGRCHESLGQRAECVSAVRKAVEVREKLAEKEWLVYGPELGRSLNNLSNALDLQGHDEEALKAAERSAQIAKEFADRNWQLYASDLGPSYNNLGKRLRKAGRFRDALPPIRLSAEVREELARGNPDEFAAALLLSLENLVELELQLGLKTEAMNTALKEVEFYDDLASRNRQRFQIGYLNALRRVARLAQQCGRFEQAMEFARREVAILRLVLAEDSAYRVRLAQSLHDLGFLVSQVGEHAEALGATLEALRMREEIAEDSFAEVGEDLAWSYANASAQLNELGRPDEALGFKKKEAEARAKLLEMGGAADKEPLAVTWVSISSQYGRIRDYDTGIIAARKAVEFAEQSHRGSGARDDWTLMMAKNNLAYCLTQVGRSVEALPVAEELRAFLDSMSPEARQVKQLEYGQLSESVAGVYRDLGRLTEAAKLSSQAIDAYEALDGETLAANAGDYAEVWHTDGTIARAAGDGIKAHHCFYRAVKALGNSSPKDRKQETWLMNKLWLDYRQSCEALGLTPDVSIQPMVEG